MTYGKWSDFCAFDLTADLGEEDHFSLVKTGKRPSSTEISRGDAEHSDRRRLRRIRKRHRDRSQQKRRLRLWSMNTVEIEWALRSCSEFDGVFAVDELPENPRLLVVNTDPINRPGRHWVCICVENGYVGAFV